MEYITISHIVTPAVTTPHIVTPVVTTPVSTPICIHLTDQSSLLRQTLTKTNNI